MRMLPAVPTNELELAVVVPTFDERENVLELFTRLEAVLAGIAYEVIVVDDDSPDGTAAAVQEVARRDPRIRVLRRIDRRGLSSACIEGMMATAARYVAVMDADLQHDERLLPAMLAKLKSEQLDLVVASRHQEGGSSDALPPWRRALSDAGKRLSRFASRSQVTDPMSGFFVADRRFLDEVVRSLSGRGFKILLDIMASSRRPVRVAELPYHFRPRLHGDSKLDLLVGIEYLHLLVDKLFGDLLPTRFVLFALVGTLGVFLHLAVLYAMLALGLKFATSQIIATVLVMTSNFFLNNIVTWRDHRLRGWAVVPGLLKFYLACSIGALLNLEVATTAIARGLPWYAAGFAGLVVGSVWNFAVTYVTTWRRQRWAARRSASASN
jgi:dolichol-phosphate mannosyltransferase